MSALKICPQCGAEYPLDVRFCQTDGTPLRTQGAEGDLVGSIVAERYHILRKLGEGGMGQVYLAEHVRMGRKSALKVMNPGMAKDVDAVTRFNREASNASRISHPNVAAVYDFGETPDGLIYLAMEFVDGPPLTKVIEQQGSLPPQRAAEIVRQAADALAVAHDMGIVHRDLKPDNIMLASTRDGGDLVKVVDFGIAKAAGAEAQKVTRTGLVVGTPEYMSPEQLAGDKLDGRSDIYSLALVAFNMLTGTLPFPSDSTQESMIMRLTDKPQPLRAMKSDVEWPAEVQRVMDRALERQASARYATATEFARDLTRAIQQMPETAAREAGTQVMSAPAASAGATAVVDAPAPHAARGVADIPPTRVSDAAPPSSRRGEGPPSSRRSEAPPSSRRSEATEGPSVPAPRRKSRGALYGVLGVIAAAAIAFAGFSLTHKPSGAAQLPAAADSTAHVPVMAATPQGSVDSTAPAATHGPATAPPTPVAGDPHPTDRAASQPNPASVSEQLATLETTVMNDTTVKTADRVLSRLRGLQLSTDDEHGHADYIRYNAYLNKNDLASACSNLRDAISRVTDAGVRDKWRRHLAECP